MAIIPAAPGFFVLDYAPEHVGKDVPPEGYYTPMDYYTRIAVVAWNVEQNEHGWIATPICAEPLFSIYGLEDPSGQVVQSNFGVFESKHAWLERVLEPRAPRSHKP